MGDGRGEEPRDERMRVVAQDAEATRVFTRDDSGAADLGPTAAGGSGVADMTGERQRSPTGADQPHAGATRRFARTPTGIVAAGAEDPGAHGGVIDTADHPGGEEEAPPRADTVGAERTRAFTRDTRDAPPTAPGDDRTGGTTGGAGRSTRPAPRRRRVRIRWIVALLLATVLALPPGTWVWVWYTARQDDRPQSDAIIVLGASQYNGRPSPVFEARLRHAADLYRDGVAPQIVTVGGNLPGDNFTEAGSGRNWLVQVGVPRDRIVAIGKGNDTLQSMTAVGKEFTAQQWSTAVIVTDPWHTLRSRKMAEDVGIDASTSPARSGPAVIERKTQLWYITRETASLWYYWIFDDSSDIRVNAA
ncbi:hypothetical protein CDO52_20070 [Nocardiopsis gilva YIM 90087]|uniref:DUF218 domain-containing protein n=1 Tax=Nocardiopsis gilva YIM 90087 TaxID=1235441 RepID=A0A223S9K5_9ACTN|nr:hypothetical protein CDO52_20070 [Nocardiopsis gilva YIM 90087]